MSTEAVPLSAQTLSFKELVFSDYERYRPGSTASWLRVVLRLPSLPGLLASLVLRAQQVLARSGRVRLAEQLRTLGNVLVGADLGPGMQIGRGFMLAHPVGVTMGYGVVIGDDVTFAGGVTCAGRYYEPQGDEVQEWATIGDRVVVGAHAVLVGGVTIGDDAMIGANSVVLSDVPAGAVVMGSPARRVGSRGPQEEKTA
ncbi:serine O-acetyltransferase [Aeromicrobium sp. Root495]|uniref:serine O-acetyltransferase n=1 Tax=Aeromicrobium sp. Root495 TaxID=1736550 RepID=UPI0009E8419F|nr:DapH/DapD/GlmU-related protein [Aeromicrobium sp. Root495]